MEYMAEFLSVVSPSSILVGPCVSGTGPEHFATSGAAFAADTFLPQAVRAQAEKCRLDLKESEYSLVWLDLFGYLQRHSSKGGSVALIRHRLGLLTEGSFYKFGICLPRACKIDTAPTSLLIQWFVFSAALGTPALPSVLPPFVESDITVHTCCQPHFPLPCRLPVSTARKNKDGTLRHRVSNSLACHGINATLLKQQDLLCAFTFLPRLQAFLEASDPSPAVPSSLLRARCESAGGTLWIVKLHRLGAPFGHGFFLARLCAPRTSCSASAVQHVVLPIISAADTSLPACVEILKPIFIDRYASWQDVKLDVALVGFPKCGTTSLSQMLNLVASRVSRDAEGSPLSKSSMYCYKNSDGECSLEDHFFNRWPEEAASHVPLSKLQVRRFNDPRADVSAKLTTGSTLRFVQETAVAIYNKASLEALVEIPRLRVVVMVRDPAEHFVSLYNYIVAGHGPEPVNLAPLLETVLSTARYRQGGLPPQPFNRYLHVEGGRFARSLSLLRTFFRDRLHVMHLDELRVGTVSMLQGLWDFLGAPRNVSIQKPRVANSGQGLFALCSPSNGSRSIRSKLTHMLADEYVWLYSAGTLFHHLRRGPCMRT